MPFNDLLLNAGVTAMQALATHMSIHTALPSAAGSNESTAARIPCSWPAAANGDFGSLTNKSFNGGAPNGPAQYVGFWSQLAVGGTWYGYLQLTGDQVFNPSGAYTITTLIVPGTATG